MNRLRSWWVAARESLWLVPTAMVAGAAALALAMIEVSASVNRDVLKHYSLFFGAGAESSRQMLSTIAGAMMTVTSVTFSITMVAVSQASSQYTSRVLRNFMRDRANQVVLGTFTSIFVYCLIVLRTVRGSDDVRFIPDLAILVAFVLAIVAIGVLVFFIHHAATSLQASSILSRIGRDTSHAIARLFPQELGEESSGTGRSEAERMLADSGWHPVASPYSGYLLEVSADGLLAFAAERDVVIRIEPAIGEPVVEGETLASVFPEKLDATDARVLTDLFVIGQHRTLEQDAAFGLRQMADVAVKALSPGVNSTSTAIIAIDNIAIALAVLAKRRVEDPYRMHAGRLRVIARGPTFEGLVGVGFDEIRRNAEGNVRVLARLLEVVALLGSRTKSPERRAVLREHALSIRTAVLNSVGSEADRRRLDGTFARTADAVGMSPA